MKHKILQFVLIIFNALTLQFLMKMTRSYPSDSVQLIELSLLCLLAGYMLQHFERTFTVRVFVFLVVALCMPFTAVENAASLWHYVLEFVTGLIFFAVGFLLPSFDWKRKIAFLVAATGIGVLLILIISPGIQYRTMAATFAYKPPGRFPTAFKFTDVNGQQVSITDLRGKVVLLDFWFIGCQPCVAKMAPLNKLASHFSTSKDVIIATVDAGFRDDFISFTEEARKFSPLMQHYYDERASEAKKMGIQGYPTEFIFDRNGIMRFTYAGYTRDIESIYYQNTKSHITQLLNEK